MVKKQKPIQEFDDALKEPIQKFTFRDNFILRQVDLLFIFVFGFIFLIAAINVQVGLAYYFFLIISSFYLMFCNYLKRRKLYLNNLK